MAKKLKDLQEVDVDYPRTAPVQVALTKLVPCSAATLFRAFEDAEFWNKFLGIVVEWTSPKPFGIGTTRTVTSGGHTIEEYFTGFEQDRVMAFRFDRATLPVAAFAEEWLINSKSADVCELVWSYGYEWGGPLESVLSPAFNTGFKLNGKRALDKLVTVIETEGKTWS